MLNGIKDFLLRLSQPGWSVLLALVLQLITFQLLRRIGVQFQNATNNHEAFDFQNKLTAADIYAQLPDYTPTSKAIYTRFFITDFFFPLFASLFLSLLWIVIFQRSGIPFFEQLVEWNVPTLAFLPAVFDWCENISFLILINRYPHKIPRLASAAVIFKWLKLLTLILTIVASVGLLLFAGFLIIRSVLAGNPGS